MLQSRPMRDQMRDQYYRHVMVVNRRRHTDYMSNWLKTQ